jgi:hypothetical protein
MQSDYERARAHLEVARGCILEDDERTQKIRHAIDLTIEALLDLEHASKDLRNVVRLPIVKR